MYTIKKRIEISAAHSLRLNYGSVCEQLHGHNWIITIYCRSEELNENGMVVDFSAIKEKIKEKLDHKNLNDVLPFNATAENIARWCVEQIPQAYKAEVRETEGNVAAYERD